MTDAPKRSDSSPPAAQPGGSIPGGEGPAFRLTGGAGNALPVLVAVPHAGREYPAKLAERIRGGSASQLRLEDRYVDKIALEIGQATGADLMIAHAPRAVLDLNRAEDDVDWSMITGDKEGGLPRHSTANRRARSGLGLIPRRLVGLGEIWREGLDRRDLDERIVAIHRPYHRALGERLDAIRDRWGVAVLVDLHSMPPLRSRYKDDIPAQFVVGDRFGTSCDGALSAWCLKYFGEQGRRVAHNRPYSGGFILDRHGVPGRNIHAIQLEVCRSAYLDAKFDKPTARMPTVARLIAGLVRGLAQRALDLDEPGDSRLAAE